MLICENIKHPIYHDDGTEHLLDIPYLQIKLGLPVIIGGADESGKENLLNILAGLAYPQAGNVQLFGESPFTLTPQKRQKLVGVFSDMVDLKPRFSLKDNLALLSAGHTVDETHIRHLFINFNLNYDEMIELNYQTLNAEQQIIFRLICCFIMEAQAYFLHLPFCILPETIHQNLQEFLARKKNCLIILTHQEQNFLPIDGINYHLHQGNLTVATAEQSMMVDDSIEEVPIEINAETSDEISAETTEKIIENISNDDALTLETLVEEFPLPEEKLQMVEESLQKNNIPDVSNDADDTISEDNSEDNNADIIDEGMIATIDNNANYNDTDAIMSHYQIIAETQQSHVALDDNAPHHSHPNQEMNDYIKEELATSETPEDVPIEDAEIETTSVEEIITEETIIAETEEKIAEDERIDIHEVTDIPDIPPDAIIEDIMLDSFAPSAPSTEEVATKEVTTEEVTTEEVTTEEILAEPPTEEILAEPPTEEILAEPPTEEILAEENTTKEETEDDERQYAYRPLTTRSTDIYQPTPSRLIDEPFFPAHSDSPDNIAKFEQTLIDIPQIDHVFQRELNPMSIIPIETETYEENIPDEIIKEIPEEAIEQVPEISEMAVSETPEINTTDADPIINNDAIVNDGIDSEPEMPEIIDNITEEATEDMTENMVDISLQTNNQNDQSQSPDINMQQEMSDVNHQNLAEPNHDPAQN